MHVKPLVASEKTRGRGHHSARQQLGLLTLTLETRLKSASMGWIRAIGSFRGQD
jgi:hypothetical protein